MNFTNNSSRRNATFIIPRIQHSVTRWFVDIVFTSLLAAVSFYVVLALIYYQFKKRKFNAEKQQHRYKKEQRFALATQIICILVAVFSLVYDLAKIVTLYVEDKAFRSNYTSLELQSFCNHFAKFREITLVVGTGLVYLFLWARQRVFYINPSLKQLNSKAVRIISYLVVGFWFLYFIPVFLVIVIATRYQYITPGGCFVDFRVINLYRFVVITWVVACALLQITLLWLFVNPLLNHTSIRGFNSKTGPNKSYKKIYSRVKRATLLSVVCLVTDIAVAITVSVFRQETKSSTLPYSFNLVINLFAIIGCYDDWKTMLLPWCSAGRKFQKQFVSSGYLTPSGNSSTQHTERKHRGEIFTIKKIASSTEAPDYTAGVKSQKEISSLSEAMARSLDGSADFESIPLDNDGTTLNANEPETLARRSPIVNLPDLITH